MQNEVQGERQRMTTAEKEWRGGQPKAGRSSIPFSAVLILCQGSPWHFCLHFIRRSIVNYDYFSNANANDNITTSCSKLSQTTLARFGLSAGTLFGSYLDIPRELEAENYTIRIAASRSLWIYGLEGPMPQFWMVHEGVGWGQLKSREYFGHFRLVILLLEAEILSELRFYMLYRSIWVPGGDSLKMIDFWAKQRPEFS